MERKEIYLITSDDLKAFFKETEPSLKDFLKRYDNVLIGVSDVARMHKKSQQTVRNYIKDGLIEPELRTVENGNFKFRMSYALSLDFDLLRIKLKERRYIESFELENRHKTIYGTGKISV